MTELNNTHAHTHTQTHGESARGKRLIGCADNLQVRGDEPLRGRERERWRKEERDGTERERERWRKEERDGTEREREIERERRRRRRRERKKRHSGCKRGPERNMMGKREREKCL